MVDNFQNNTPDLNDPAYAAFSITPGNSPLASFPRAIFIGTEGDVEIEDFTGAVSVFKNLQSGSILPVRCKKVLSSNTTATDIIGLY